jgi:uncharacterized membrane protein YphA (DoxX/SURF4 family)
VRLMHDLSIAPQVLVMSAIFFVWVVRYDNIVQEFRQYRLPDWLRDLVGILKLTCATLLLVGIALPRFAVVGAAGIALLMACAIANHLRVKNPVFKMLPSLCLLALSVVIAVVIDRSMAP